MDGEVRPAVTDFGLAKLLEGESGLRSPVAELTRSVLFETMGRLTRDNG